MKKNEYYTEGLKTIGLEMCVCPWCGKSWGAKPHSYRSITCPHCGKCIYEVFTKDQIKKYTKTTENLIYNDQKETILNFYKENVENYPSDVAYALNMDLKLTIKIVNELVEEGKLI